MTDHTERNRRYDAAPSFVQAQVDALLGMTTPRQSPDAGKPLSNLGPVSPDKAKTAQDTADKIASMARGMG